MNTKDVLELLETARYTCDDHIHGYDYHIYCLLLEAIDEATDKIEKFEDGLKTTKKNLEAQVKELEAALGRPLENAIEHIQHECYNDALSSIHEARAALAERNE